jgi:thymidylate synthase
MTFENIRAAYLYSLNKLYARGQYVDNFRWQGIETAQSEQTNQMKEMVFLNFKAKMPQSRDEAHALLDFDKLPMGEWADEHFDERVSGVPYNPPPSHIRWHNGTSGDYKSEAETEVFSHTYPERFWYDKVMPDGLRFPNGNLNSIVDIFKADPNTRQAFMPMFLFEDLTASARGERVPCSLGWNFIQRNGCLHMAYALRSCDAIRHFANDLYMAIRLAQWVNIEAFNGELQMGFFQMNVTSFHCFKNDDYRLSQMIKMK